MLSNNLPNPETIQGINYIRNMGDTSYLSSLLPVFFHIPVFRYAILNVNDGKPFDQKNALHQMKKLFKSLLGGDQSTDSEVFKVENGAIIPFELLGALQNLEGKPLNPIEVMDVQEFNTLF